MPGAPAPALAVIDRLAILVVYVVRDGGDERLLDLHLERVARHTATPYTLYAATPRVSARARQTLGARPEVRLVPTGDAEQRGSREHAYHLDALLHTALADAPSHVVTLDLDSFPIADDWLARLLAVAPEESGVAGILRAENLDTALPHPSCLLMPASLPARHPFSFSPDTDGTPGFRRFLRERHQAADTGIRLARLLDRLGLSWGRLVRTNTRDLHPLIAGIYGDCVFHLGAGARDSLFRRDLAVSRAHRLTEPLDRLPVPTPLRPAKQRLLRTLRRPAERRIIAVNGEAAARARAWLTRDPDGLFAYLRGDPAPAG